MCVYILLIFQHIYLLNKQQVLSMLLMQISRVHRAQGLTIRRWSRSWCPAVKSTCWIYVQSSEGCLPHLCTKWLRYVFFCLKNPPPNYSFSYDIEEILFKLQYPSAYKQYISLSLVTLYYRVILLVIILKPCLCCVAVMMPKSAPGSTLRYSGNFTLNKLLKIYFSLYMLLMVMLSNSLHW